MKYSDSETPASEIDRIAAVRHFNRFYTRTIGTLKEGLLQSTLTLTEARVLYEIASRRQCSASEIAAELNLDMGYLSRILRAFVARKLISRKSSAADGRQQLLSLTAAGRRQFATLDQRSNQQIQQMIHPLDAGKQTRLVEAMNTIEALLAPQPIDIGSPAFMLRPHRPGDIGWVIERHGALYALEHGWDETFEAFVARIAADIIDHFDPLLERCWIADRNGERLGCVFLVKDSESAFTAKLRLLIVEPAARGLGFGRALVAECTRFARAAGYRRIILWTNSVLDAARHLYQNEGYRLVEETPHHSFGQDLIGQNWELEL